MCLFSSYNQPFHMTDSPTIIIPDIFTKNLPCIPPELAHEFATGIQAYHAAFKTHRDTAMNCELLPEYQASTYIMKVPGDQFWPFTPNFRKIVALTIQHLFKTDLISLSSSRITMDQTLVYVDKGANRWIMTIGEPTCDHSTTYPIYMYFPRFNTPTCTHFANTTPLEHLLDSSHLREHGLCIVANDIQHWTQN